MRQDPYSIYVRTFGKVTSKARITDADYGTMYLGRFFRHYDRDGQIAVTMAIRDVAYDGALRTMSEFEEELRNTLG